MKYTKEHLTNLVNESKCMWDVVEKAGMSKQQGNYSYLWRAINRLGISISHFEDQRKGQGCKRKGLEEFFIKGKYLTISGNLFKRKLYKAGLKKPICEKCGQGEIWNGEKISLILDHKDGDRENNLLENLQIVCPNCNATLNTHCGRNRKKK